MTFLKIYISLVFFSLSINILQAENLGHRLGGDIFKPGDTIYSYEKLINKFNKSSRIKLIEFDIQETKDKHLVVFHDINKIYRVVPKSEHNLRVLKKILSSKKFKDITIHDISLSQIKNLRLEHNATIPTLSEVLQKSVDLNINYLIHIEIKRIYTDTAREELIKILKQYKKYLKMELIAFRKNFKVSFPFPDKWLSKFSKLEINFYQIGKHKYTFISKKKYIRYQTLLDKKFSINKKNGRKIEFILNIPYIDIHNMIFIGVFNGHDNSGDKGLNIKLLTIGNKCIFSEFSDDLHWQWFKIPSPKTKDIKVIVEDLDTNFTGKYSGNGGRIKIILGEINKK